MFLNFFLIILVFAALTIPNLEDIIPLVGITSGTFLAFIIPALIDSILFIPAYMKKTGGKLRGRALFILIRNICLCLVGIFGLIFGLNNAINNLFKEL